MSLDNRVDTLESKVEDLDSKIHLLLQHIQEVKASISEGFEKVNENFIKVNNKIDKIQGNSNSTLETVEVKLDDLKTEISKINDITGYDSLFENSKNLRIVKGGN